jgi:glycosyltransferase involved in cell wall biosynthesis
MPQHPLVSIIVNNYNYGRFLKGAIDSARGQTYDHVEVIVVDDGSTDDSRDVITSFEDRIGTVLKENGGQASAFNEGFARSSGDIVIFLDSDDVLLPTAAERVVEQFRSGVAKIHWPLVRVDEQLNGNDQQIPSEELPAGDLREATLRDGPGSSLSPPTSGNAWSREFLARMLPMSVDEHRIGADGYLYGLAPAFGSIGRVEEPQGMYRIHPTNNYKHMDVHERIGRGVRSFEMQVSVLASYAESIGRAADVERWRNCGYFHRLRQALADIESNIPEGDSFILLDESRWSIEQRLGGRTVFPFLERDGVYWGCPADDDVAISEIRRMQKDYAAKFVVVGWPAFWWLAEYRVLAQHLSSECELLIGNERVKIYSLGEK